ncbi:MAG: DUF4870 domain-containing protein [Ornithinibacter sp.]
MSDQSPHPSDTPTDPTAALEEHPELAAPTTEHPPAPEAAQPPPPPPPPYAQQPPAYLPVPTTPMAPSDERTTGMAAHGVALAATVFSGGTLGFVCALVMYLVFRDRGPFVRHHTANALNVQILAGIGFIVGIIFCLTIIGLIIGIPLILAAGLYAVIVHIIGAIKANNGEWWTPPLTPQFVK